MKIDRRINRTRNNLIKALRDLILEKGYEDIKLQEIIDKADVGRTSFYSHFKSKEDLLLSNFESFESVFETEFLKQTTKKSEDFSAEEVMNDEIAAFSLHMFQHIKKNWQLAKLLMGNKRLLFIRNHVERKIYTFFKVALATEKKNIKNDELECFASMAAGSLVAITLNWFTMRHPTSPEKLSQIFNENMVFIRSSPTKNVH